MRECTADVDGSHIKGLVINMLHNFWPSLLTDVKSFVTSMMTPIVKAKKGREVLSFYTMTEYQDWLSRTNNGRGFQLKYYKVLPSYLAVHESRGMCSFTQNNKNVYRVLGLAPRMRPENTFGTWRRTR